MTRQPTVRDVETQEDGGAGDSGTSESETEIERNDSETETDRAPKGKGKAPLSRFKMGKIGVSPLATTVVEEEGGLSYDIADNRHPTLP
jgi:hypothetical protein